MGTRIEVYEIANPKNVVASWETNRNLTAAEIRKELPYLMRYLDPKKFTHQIIKK